MYTCNIYVHSLLVNISEQRTGLRLVQDRSGLILVQDRLGLIVVLDRSWTGLGLQSQSGPGTAAVQSWSRKIELVRSWSWSQS